MEELDHDYQAHQKNDTSQLAVRFYVHPLQDDDKSAEAGRPIFNDTEMVEIRVRGDRNNIVQRPVRPSDKQVFRDAYRAFKEDVAQGASGTPLAEWPAVSRSQVEELKYMQFFTVEQVAGASDAVCSKMAGLTGLKQKAQAYIEFAKGNSAPIEVALKKLEELAGQVQALSQQNAELSAALAKKAG